MNSYPYPMLNPPPFKWNKGYQIIDPKVHEWIQTIDAFERVNWSAIDVTILGVPLSRSSISPSAASETPDAIRRAWKFFYPYNLDYDIDIVDLRVVDLGDVKQHVTDIQVCHRQITEAMVVMRETHPHTLPLAIGGDHSITAMLVKGWKQTHPEEEIGILQFDTHFDLRDVKTDGPTNGTPIRYLIESNIIKGNNVYNIGPHGFFNAKSLKQFADKAHVNYITLKEARMKGINQTVQKALDELSNKVDTIYVTVDMDVLDIGPSPGVPASSPGGMRTDELFEAVYLAGKAEKVKAMDLVCIDPNKDLTGGTVKTGVHVMLSFLTGYKQRKGRGL